MTQNSQSSLAEALLQLPEDINFEFKRAAVQPRKLLETVCAFANTEGGYLIIGLSDSKQARGPKRLVGISENMDNVSEFKKLLRTEFDPPLQHYISISDEPIINATKIGDFLTIVAVEKCSDIHSLKNGDTYVRKGSQNIKIGASEILRKRYEKGSIKFEDESSDISNLKDLDGQLLSQYQTDTKSQGEDIWQFLKDNGLVLSAKKKDFLTNSAVLLFGKNPTTLLKRKCAIKISHYFGTVPSFSGEPNFVRRPFTIEGPLIYQIEEAVRYFQNVVKESSPKLIGGTFRPSLLIPEWVFQEAIANAVIHRNYAVQDDIQVRFFDDRIEVESPGTYPAHITPKNLREERFARNPILQRVLNRFESAPNLDIGEGVDRMFQLMMNHNLYEPVYYAVTQRPNSVLLILINQHKIDYWDTVSRYLDKKGKITNQQTRDITGIKDTLHTTRLLNDWVKNNLLEKRGGKTRGAYYIKTGQDLSSLLFKASEK